ncbi:MAG: nucleotidyl transferase AbiEii/AbiGii toxin family protein [Candidatus Sumerlaeota bacterium]|nr:nucleotidyl transferase AbiEii/AbiGii toxin family protein [Candidatus Sumerlaeota bacterium]
MDSRDQLQRLLVRVVATHRAGIRLCLIGGFRLRFLSQSARMSEDVDYHWDGDLDEKQGEIITLLRRHLLPEVRRSLGFDGSVFAATGPDADSPATRVVNAAFYRVGVPHSRIEISVDITRIVCHDRFDARPADGVVYPTVSDQDLIESKVIALFSRAVVQARDLVDLFLFGAWLSEDSAKRIRRKLKEASLSREAVAGRLRLILAGRSQLIRNIQAVLDTQMEPAAAANINAAGGCRRVFDGVWDLIHEKLNLVNSENSKAAKRKGNRP